MGACFFEPNRLESDSEEFTERTFLLFDSKTSGWTNLAETMFSNFSGNLTGVTNWISDQSKNAASQIQKSVNEIIKEPAAGETAVTPESPEEQDSTDVSPTEIKTDPAPKNEVLTQVSQKFVSDVSSVFGSALSFGKSAIAKVEQNEYVQNATKVVTETVTEGVKMVENAPLVKDFNKEQEKFIAENKSSGKIKVPWEGYQDEEQLKEQILALSKDKRNFLRAPPAGAQFEFDYTKSQPLALAVLEHDNNLIEMRFQLVPKVTKEVDFWRNYFYRISLIKQSAQPLELPEEDVKEEKDAPTDETEEIKNLEEEFASEEVGTKSEDLPQWEKELQDELQEYEVVEEDETNGEWEKELEDMLGEAPEATKTEPEPKKAD